MTYQAAWLKGVQVQEGDRPCEHRYQIVRRFCEQFSRPFTVLDIGANLAYFSLRLTEEFDCTAVAIEGSQSGEACFDLLTRNENPRVILLQRDVTLDELRQVAEVEHFDLVLALSITHHFPESFEERLDVFRSLGDHLILELAHETESGHDPRKAYALPADAQILGYGEFYLNPSVLRDIALLSRAKTHLSKRGLGEMRNDLSLTITSTFRDKRVQFHNKPEERPWHRGINLLTYLTLGGVWPTKAMIVRQLEAITLDGTHGDIQPWAVILQGEAVQLIDAADPNNQHQADDAKDMRELIERLRG